MNCLSQIPIRTFCQCVDFNENVKSQSKMLNAFCSSFVKNTNSSDCRVHCSAFLLDDSVSRACYGSFLLDGALFIQTKRFTKASRNLLFLLLPACFTESWHSTRLSSLPHTGSKRLKPAENKFTQRGFTSFSM